MRGIWLWGAGRYVALIKKCIIDKSLIKGIFDNAKELSGQTKENIEVFMPQQGLVGEEDILIITIPRFRDICDVAVPKLGIHPQQIISFFNESCNKKSVQDIIDTEKWSDLLEYIKLQNENESLKLKLSNYEYEYASMIQRNQYLFPQILDGEDALKLVIEQNKSLCRFGDGEFELMLGHSRPFFQKVDDKLGKKLYEVLKNKKSNVLVCIADNYGNLDKYTDTASEGIRKYLSKEVRKEHMALLDLDRVYYDAYVSRPYIMYKDKDVAKDRFRLWKNVWKNRNIVIVEGELTRSGVKNDLFKEVNSIKRILCPAEHAWGYYKEIYETIVHKVSKDELIMIALGPTATVLAYELSLQGYQAIDMGHLDNEYEWYLRNASEVENIKYKYVNDYNAGRYAEDIEDIEYEKQTIARIGI